MADISITTKKKYFFYFLRFVIYLTCFGAFSQQIVNIFEGHFQNLTAIASGLKIVKEINLPALTICPGVAFKSVGPFFTEKEFISHAFDLNDILSDHTIEKLSNKTLYKINEVRNVLHGRCFTIYFLGINSNLRSYIYRNYLPN